MAHAFKRENFKYYFSILLDMEIKKEVVILLVFIVIGLVFLSASNSIVNKLLVGNTGLRGTCHDTDSGIPGNEFVKGTVSGDKDNGVSFERTDYCIDAYQLKEYSCDTSTSSNFRIGSNSVNGNGNSILCKNGCKNGACIT